MHYQWNTSQGVITEPHADETAQRVQWVRLRGIVKEPYSKYNNARLEDAFQASESCVSMLNDGQMWIVDLRKMQEYTQYASLKRRPGCLVERRYLTKRGQIVRISMTYYVCSHETFDKLRVVVACYRYQSGLDICVIFLLRKNHRSCRHKLHHRQQEAYLLQVQNFSVAQLLTAAAWLELFYM